MRFARCNKEYCIYVQKVGVDWIIIVVYVDDLTIMSKSLKLINNIKRKLSMRFKMKDLGDIHYILKMGVRRNRENKTMSISQHQYILDLLKKYKIEKGSAVTTPQLAGHELEPETNMSAAEIAAQNFDYRGLMAGCSVSWCSSLQGCVSLSTAEAELIALSEGAKESECLWHLLSEMGFKQELPVQVCCDGRSAINITKNPGNHKASKHNEIMYLFTRDLVEEGRLTIEYCPTANMTADILTKALPTKQFTILRTKIGVKDLATVYT
ncbi:unnamed protein product [Phytophthora fragariaefolia]|uniref:Unnamed protein product n=1 Tax=Phytophthora fragariaefolia TaxID=1490495 RepID=A0A9W6YBY3_9STRA|nr:unnamed protein product [Phytophthora fragariaefolia]